MQIHLDGPRSHAEKLMESPFNLNERRKPYAASKQRGRGEDGDRERDGEGGQEDKGEE